MRIYPIQKMLTKVCNLVKQIHVIPYGNSRAKENNHHLETMLYELRDRFSHLAWVKEIHIDFNCAAPTVLFLHVDSPELKKMQESQLLDKDKAKSPLEVKINHLIPTLFYQIISPIFSSFPLFQKIIVTENLSQENYTVSLEIDRQRWLGVLAGQSDMSK